VDESAAVEDALAGADAIRIAEALAPVMTEDEAGVWLRREVTAALEEYDRDPSRAYTLEEVRAHLAADRAARDQRA
jgi:hypothetical protein